jgi:Ca2+-binding EF-hand superfamily protein
MACSKAEAKEALTKAFKAVDLDGSGSIDSQELEKVLESYYKSTGKGCDAAKVKKEAQAFLQEVDKNKDNKVCLDEFLTYFMQFCS